MVWEIRRRLGGAHLPEDSAAFVLARVAHWLA